MSTIAALGYLGLTAPDLDEWATFATDVLGASVAPGATDDGFRLRVDDRAWRISVERGESGLAFCGWEVRSAQALDALVRVLDDHGVEHRRDPELAADRGVEEVVVGHDPGGNRLEFFYAATVDAKRPFVSPTGARFVTSHEFPGDMGVGHVVVFSSAFAESRRFYLDVLGFRVSDQNERVLFAHTNARHHSVALIDVGDHAPPSSVHHFMLEVDDIDVVGRALDTVERRGDEITISLGRHSNDHMISFYVKSPSGCLVEYGTGARRIDDAVWLPAKYPGDLWGHKFRAPVV